MLLQLNPSIPKLAPVQVTQQAQVRTNSDSTEEGLVGSYHYLDSAGVPVLVLVLVLVQDSVLVLAALAQACSHKHQEVAELHSQTPVSPKDRLCSLQVHQVHTACHSHNGFAVAEAEDNKNEWPVGRYSSTAEEEVGPLLRLSLEELA